MKNGWETLPPELHREIYKHADAFTKFLAGWYDTNVDPGVAIAIWRQVLALNWIGELSKLPQIPIYLLTPDDMVQVSNKQMYYRVQKYWGMNSLMVCIPIKHLWGDLYAFDDPNMAIKAQALATMHGYLNVLQYYTQKGTLVDVDIPWIKSAACNGHLHTIQFWHEQQPNVEWNQQVMDYAAKYGYLTIVKWLHENRMEGCTTKAMDYAAENGHLHLVKWLHENRTEGCTSAAMYWSAYYGHLKVVKYLCENHMALDGIPKAIRRAKEQDHRNIYDYLVHQQQIYGLSQ